MQTLVPIWECSNFGLATVSARSHALRIVFVSSPDHFPDRHGDSSNQDNEHVSASVAIMRGIIVADNTPSLFLDRAALHFNSGPNSSIQAIYRDFTARHSKAEIYAETVCRK